MTTPTEQAPIRQPGFAELGIPAEVIAVLSERNITTPTQVQVEAIPMAQRGGDIVVQAKTGTGKTFAFGLPLVAGLAAPEGRLTRALVVTPTRELCIQVAADLALVGAALGLRVTTVYGGQDFAPQIASLQAGVDIVVGTPGRLLDLVSRGELDLSGVDRLILDEADEMLDMGFLPDVQKILKHTAGRTSTMLFSATMPGPIWSLARGFLNQPTYTTVYDPDSDASTVKGVTQFVYQAHPLDKPQMLAKLLQAEGRGPTIVFCRTKMTAQRLADDMTERGFAAVALHGDLAQPARERALQDFRNGSAQILIATDVAARGIDIDGITHVVNYQTPEDAATYLHRIGRTARAGRTGTAVTFVEWDNLTRWKYISVELGLGSDVPAETFSTSAHFFTDLGIDEHVSGRVRPAATPERSPRHRGDQGTQTARSVPNGRGREAAPQGSGGGTTRDASARSGNRSRQRNRTRNPQQGVTSPTATHTGTAPTVSAPTGSAPRHRQRTRRSAVQRPTVQ